MSDFYTDSASTAVQIRVLTEEQLASWLPEQSPTLRRWVDACGFVAEPLQTCLVSNAEGGLQLVLLGIACADDFWCFGNLPRVLPKGVYSIDNSDGFFTTEQYELALLAWGLGCYQFNTYVHREDFIGRVLHVESSVLQHLE